MGRSAVSEWCSAALELCSLRLGHGGRELARLAQKTLMEIEARRFCEAAAQRTSDAGIRQLLDDLAQEEPPRKSQMPRPHPVP